MGGPLYFLYKIITTINLAKELKQKYPQNKFVPVFWMATEDHDFDEINHFQFSKQTFPMDAKRSGAVGVLSTSELSGVYRGFPMFWGIPAHALS